MDPRQRVRKIAAKQHGAFSRQQAMTSGLSRHQITTSIANGTFRSAARGVLFVDGSRDTWERRAMVRVLSAGAGSVVSRRAAAFLHGMLTERPSLIEVASPATRRPRGARRLRALSGPDVRRISGIPVTCPGRTLVDLASVSRRDLETALDNALASGLATSDGIRRYITTRHLGRQKGVGHLIRLLDDRERYGVPQGELEREFIRLLERHDLPQAARQWSIGARRADFAYPSIMVAVELDGRRDHSRKSVFEDDRARQNEFVLAGWTVLRFTWDDVMKRPDKVARTICDALRTGGGT